MSIIRADSIKNRAGDGAPDFPNGITVTGIVTATTLNSTTNNVDVDDFISVGSNIHLGNAGVVTATTFVGNLTGNPTGTLQTAAQPNITSVGTLSSLNVSGNVSIAGTLTYEDVTNVDSVGVITARGGLVSPYADIDDFISVGSNIHLGNAGIITASSYRGDGSQLTGIVADKIFEGNTEVETIDTGSDGHVKITTEGAERLRITSSGAVMINTTNSSSRTLNLNGTFGILSTNQSGVLDMSVTDAGAASIGPYVAGGSTLILKTNASGSGVAERLRISSVGTLTNTTTSSHSQGAGTFNIKGVINQYSQGSGSGLIFDCDFGRLTGYADNASIGNGTNLSAALAHSTTDWTSSSSNTPMTVNGGSYNYRVGFGGYLDCVQNEGRVSVGAGSGSPNMAETLNTASMTIESWIWYDGAGREVIVSRYGLSLIHI